MQAVKRRCRAMTTPLPPHWAEHFGDDTHPVRAAQSHCKPHRRDDSGRRVQPQAGGPVLLGSVPVALVTAALVRLVWRWIMADQFWLHDVQ